jgi:pimeloyl-ACP methyl ester carboxylesterase
VGEYDSAKVKLNSGVSLSYHEEGTGKNLLILLHGLNAHSGTWRKNISQLATEERKVVAPSLSPWSGRPPPDISDYTDQVYELIEILDASTVSIAGNSMGGWIAMKIAKRLGGTTKALILEDTAGTRDPFDEEAISSTDSLGIPVLIIWGKDDPMIPSSDAETLHSKIRNSELHVFPDTGHVPHWEKPDVFNKLVDDFLSSNGA